MKQLSKIPIMFQNSNKYKDCDKDEENGGNTVMINTNPTRKKSLPLLLLKQLSMLHHIVKGPKHKISPKKNDDKLVLS